MASYINVNQSDFQREVLDSDIPVLVDFWAPWCGPCRSIAPIVEQLGADYAGKVKVAKIDVDKNPQIAAQFGVRGIPAIKVFKGGKVQSEMLGFPPNAAAKLRKLVDEAL
ncbi:MAG: thioredoxin [bacterium]|nr:thioredoxin [Myxococcales bacterium]MCB9551158.1 thioredoxin [Myxococcales bacterium]